MNEATSAFAMLADVLVPNCDFGLPGEPLKDCRRREQHPRKSPSPSMGRSGPVRSATREPVVAPGSWRTSSGRPAREDLSWLAVGFEAMHPASLLGFITTPHSDTLLDGRPATPVKWITARRDVQTLLDLLDTRPWT